MEAITSNPLFMPVLLTLIIIAAFPLVAGYLVLVERKVLADIQVRLGPMRVGPHGFLQPLQGKRADSRYHQSGFGYGVEQQHAPHCRWRNRYWLKLNRRCWGNAVC